MRLPTPEAFLKYENLITMFKDMLKNTIQTERIQYAIFFSYLYVGRLGKFRGLRSRSRNVLLLLALRDHELV
jgi:hypothetical protein